jgi:hypothetical protein
MAYSVFHLKIESLLNNVVFDIPQSAKQKATDQIKNGFHFRNVGWAAWVRINVMLRFCCDLFWAQDFYHLTNGKKDRETSADNLKSSLIFKLNIIYIKLLRTKSSICGSGFYKPGG